MTVGIPCKLGTVYVKRDGYSAVNLSQMGTISEEEYFNAIDSMADAALEDGCTATNPESTK